MDRDICIIGGGIGGLAAALAFAARGARVRVLEQAGALKEVGAGIQISPNGMRVLDALNIGPQVREDAVIGKAVSLRRAESDREVARLCLTSGSPYAFVHRADLIGRLAQAAQEAGVAVELGAPVSQIVPGQGARVVLQDGTERLCDLAVDASGVHSTLRRTLNPHQEPFFTGQVAWRALVPNRAGRGAEVHVHMAPGAHLVSYPLRGRDVINIVGVQERTDWAADGWTHQDDPANLRAAFAGSSDAVQSLLASVDQVHLWGLFRHDVADVWSAPGATLLGDAAHPTLPFLAQGANMALEDAWMLAACVAQSPRDGAQLYQSLRRSRVLRAIKTANGNAKRYHLRRGPVRLAAHLGLKTVSTLAPALMTAPFGWLYDYDVTADAPA